MLTHITQMDIRSPPAVCASVVYDTARRQWVPKVKLIYDGKEHSVECGSSPKMCVCTGHSRIEIGNEEVCDEEAMKVLGPLWEKVEEPRKKVDDMLQIADEMQTAFVVESDEEDSSKSDEDEESLESRPPSPQPLEQRKDDEREKEVKTPKPRRVVRKR